MTAELPSTHNSRAVERLVQAAARARFGRRCQIRSVYEHAHWWVIVRPPEDEDPDDADQIYDVVDTTDGFDFERV